MKGVSDSGVFLNVDMKQIITILFCCMTIMTGQAQNHRLWYNHPATHWLQALPVGNSQLGAMIFGGITTEEIQLNEETFWSGSPHNNNSPEAKAHLQEVRQLIFQGREQEAHAIIDKYFIKGPHGMRFLPLGSLKLSFDYGTASLQPTSYERELSLGKAVNTTNYQLDGVNYQRTVFASQADPVIIVRLQADKPEALTFNIAYESQLPARCCVSQHQLSATIQNVEQEGIPGKLTAECRILAEADGEIVDGRDYQEIAADRFVAEIDKIRKDKTIKSVVLRVNSPGGSVVASEKIRTALKLLMDEKPVVASYGNYAASGGYWISAGTQKIFSDATCLTGSIGVFSMIPEFSKTIGKVGVNLVTVGSNKHSDMYSLTRPFDAEETASLQLYVDDVYERFVGLVAEGRSLETQKVDDMAQGRVWVGTDALGLGLVDEIGGLRQAVDYAASLAGYLSKGDYHVVTYPAQLTQTEMLLDMSSGGRQEPSILADTPFEELGKTLGRLRENEPSQVYARLPYDIEIR